MKPSLVVARKEIRDHLRDRRSLLSSALMALMGPGIVLIVSLSDRAQGPNAAAVMLGMLSIFALVSSFSGGVEIAMDVSAGERERRSLLPLLLNPVSRSGLLIGKWLAVSTFGLASVALNAVGLVLVLARAAPAELAARAPQLFVWVVFGLMPLACLGAALNLLVAALCRTTKEAHTALRIVSFAPMVVGMFLVFFPESIVHTWSALPIVGQQILIGMNDRAASPGSGAILALVTMAAAVLTLAGAIGLLSRDDILAA
jgi:sodium transport system permease protein